MNSPLICPVCGNDDTGFEVDPHKLALLDDLDVNWQQYVHWEHLEEYGPIEKQFMLSLTPFERQVVEIVLCTDFGNTPDILAMLANLHQKTNVSQDGKMLVRTENSFAIVPAPQEPLPFCYVEKPPVDQLLTLEEFDEMYVAMRVGRPDKNWPKVLDALPRIEEIWSPAFDVDAMRQRVSTVTAALVEGFVAVRAEYLDSRS